MSFTAQQIIEDLKKEKERWENRDAEVERLLGMIADPFSTEGVALQLKAIQASNTIDYLELLILRYEDRPQDNPNPPA